MHADDELDILITLSASSLKSDPINKHKFTFKKLIECHKLTLINTENNIEDFFVAVLTAYLYNIFDDDKDGEKMCLAHNTEKVRISHENAPSPS